MQFEVTAPLRYMSVLLSMRLLPFAVYVLLTSAAFRSRVISAAGYLMVSGLACWLGAGSSIEFLATGFIYYLLISLGVNRLSGLVATGRLTRGGALVVIFFAFLLLPGVVLPGVALSTFLVVGCELALSSYSYCVETSRRGATTATLRDCLFFLFVNPTVVYTVRGTAVATQGGFSGWRRAAAGVTIMFLNVAILRPFAIHVRHGLAFAGVPAGATVSLLLYGMTGFFTVYAAHSGLAHIHIGLMRQIGWAVPERYRYPLLSTSPFDFWRRWNTYVRVWLEAYVFLPLARKVSRKTKLRSAQVAAAVATLAASGALHCAVTFAGRQNLAALKLEAEFFLAAGVLLAVWRIAAFLGNAVQARLDPLYARRFAVVAGLSARLGVATALVAATIEWG
jgi:hypothetical protein